MQEVNTSDNKRVALDVYLLKSLLAGHSKTQKILIVLYL